MLQEGNCQGAAAILQHALLELQLSFRSLANEEASDEETWAINRAHNAAETGAENPVEELLAESESEGLQTRRAALRGMPITAVGTTDANMNAACLLLYDRAFRICDGEIRERVISSIILYNFALANHIMGLNRGSSKNLNNGLMLYKFSYRILREAMDEGGSTALLTLALYNNMGHASFQLFQLEEATHYVKCLREEMGLSDNDSFGADLPTIDDEDYDFFSFNLAIQVELTAAPAA